MLRHFGFCGVYFSIVATSSVALGAQDHYTISIDGADDHLSCTLNGMSIGPTVSFGHAATYPLQPKAKGNILVCTDKDDDAPSSPCWAYSYKIMHDQTEIAKISNTCCSSQCPPPFPTTTIFNAD